MHSTHLTIMYGGFIVCNLIAFFYLRHINFLTKKDNVHTCALGSLFGIIATITFYAGFQIFTILMALYVIYSLHLKHYSEQNEKNQSTIYSLIIGTSIGCFSYTGCMMCT
jgi:hypothetical protein